MGKTTGSLGLTGFRTNGSPGLSRSARDAQRLEPFIVRRSRGPDTTIGVSEAAARLEVPCATVRDWVARRTLLAWKAPGRDLTIPAAQIVGPGEVVPDLDGVLEVIGDPELAWTFLTQEWPFAEEVARPLDKLADGQTKEVLDAAPGFGATFA